jgi:hypothetical protein
MRRTLLSALILGFGFVALLLMAETSFAQGEPNQPGTLELSNIFAWALTDPPNWALGAWYAAVGFAGALVTIFGLVGGTVPGTAGQARIDENSEQLRRISKRLEDVITPNPMKDPLDSQGITAIGQAVRDLRDNISRERRYQFAIAAILYSVLGAFFASALVQDLLQALVIGAGWTGLTGSLGLKKDFTVRKSSKDAALDTSFTVAQRLKESQGELLNLYLNAQGITNPEDPMQLANKPDAQRVVNRVRALETDVERLEQEVSLAKTL